MGPLFVTFRRAMRSMPGSRHREPAGTVGPGHGQWRRRPSRRPVGPGTRVSAQHRPLPGDLADPRWFSPSISALDEDRSGRLQVPWPG